VQVARVPQGDLPAELGVVAFLRRAVHVHDGLGFCIDQRGRFECLHTVVRPPTVVLARVFTVEKRRIKSGVPRGLVLLRGRSR
jgi:hypothetical protein